MLLVFSKYSANSAKDKVTKLMSFTKQEKMQ